MVKVRVRSWFNVTSHKGSKNWIRSYIIKTLDDYEFAPPGIPPGIVPIGTVFTDNIVRPPAGGGWGGRHWKITFKVIKHRVGAIQRYYIVYVIDITHAVWVLPDASDGESEAY